jgi:outer membrane protein assembly factor BamB
VLWTEPEGGTGIAVPTGASAVYITGVPSGTNGAGITQAFDATTGATIWQDDPNPGAVYSSAALSPDGTALYVAGLSGTRAFSTESGTQL